MASDLLTARTLSKREAELVGWLEAERIATLSTSDVRETLGWADTTIHQVLSRLAAKGWIRRTAQGRYEAVLAETGGWSLPNPWAALATWGQQYYVGFKSAAYERQLTPDRPGSVQTCVPVGAKRPRAWKDVPITLVYLPAFDSDGIEERELHGFRIRIASIERTLIDGGVLPGRIGGILGLARVLDRGAEVANWSDVARLATHSPRGRAGLRRLAALLEVLGRTIPEPLAKAATARPGDSPLFLVDRRTHGAHGIRLTQWQVVVNIDPAVIHDELRH